jgi:hypothetical protein
MIDWFAWIGGIVIGFIIGKVYTNFRRIMKQSKIINKGKEYNGW